MTSSQDSAHVSCMLLGEDVLHVKQDSMALLAARSLDVQVLYILSFFILFFLSILAVSWLL